MKVKNQYLKMKSSFPKRYKSILIVFMKMTFFYLDPYILLIFLLILCNIQIFRDTEFWVFIICKP